MSSDLGSRGFAECGAEVRALNCLPSSIGLPISSQSRDSYWCSRIVGLPGEHISLKPSYVCVDGQPVTQPEIFVTIGDRRNGHSGYVLPPATLTATRLRTETDVLQLGANEYFVLGDNSPMSLDSRFWGPLPRRNIVGKVALID